MDVFGVLLKICLIEILKVKLTITFLEMSFIFAGSDHHFPENGT